MAYSSSAAAFAARSPEPLPEVPTALFVGVLESTKNLDGLARAWTDVVRRLPGARLHLVGDGSLRAVAERLVGGVGVVPEQVGGGEDQARGAGPARQRMLGVERLVQRVPLAVGQALDRGDLGAVRLHGQHRTALHRHAVEQHGARTAVGGVAADRSAGLAQHIPQIVD